MGPDLVGVQERHAGVGLGLLLERLELVLLGGDVQHAGFPEVAVDVVFADRLGDARKVFVPEFGQSRVFLGQVGFAVGFAMDQRGFAEAAVAPGGRPADGFGIDQHHLARRVRLFGLQGRPQSRVSAADHEQVGGDVAFEGGKRGGAVGVLQPVGGVVGSGE